LGWLGDASPVECSQTFTTGCQAVPYKRPGTGRGRQDAYKDDGGQDPVHAGRR